ncbi:predicted protein [Uncinocarpus reesii 1704]|uniref:Aminoglycoside phosphotransferase domain-containing protein n=1 Tax=Uncinocarpus reesii (strain UAMH 1704) TaxID=336963 RepID=C4JU87_UNCRE|nr:uncharacterized protein UREG_06026 [Uncinocarpus reesii 1704]EEP81184.1 predicted protein [Uncinocarpus reesii 1704]
MVRTRRLRRGEVTYSWARNAETNILVALEDHKKTIKLCANLLKKSALLQQAAAHHLRLSPEQCEPSHPKSWLFGSFNVCIPISVPGNKEVLMRFPILHRIGESFRPGNADEKLRCEAGAYAWLRENCPSIPVPKLYGFSLSTGQNFTAIENLPPVPRLLHHLRRRLLKLFGCAVPSAYIPQEGLDLSILKAGYLLIERIPESYGRMLSCTWEDKRHDKGLRANLFKGISKTILTLAQVPVPRIGSFMIDDSGFLTLSNRPLTLEIMDSESQQIPVDIPRDMTYSSVNAYVLDCLSFHDNRLHFQPNAINDSPYNYANRCQTFF